MFTISKVSVIIEEKKVFVANKEYVTGHGSERMNMVAKCKILTPDKEYLTDNGCGRTNMAAKCKYLWLLLNHVIGTCENKYITNVEEEIWLQN